ncbi:MAG: adenylosuccinate synthase [Defluviitaleaceae bacterium]|nr:adenylosuccinate synthase [Defluviitaleaceae bacterium]
MGTATPNATSKETSGKITAIVGANWGDEGKGKIIDNRAGQSDIVVRFQGGSNAGHTILNPYGKFALHQLPSGIFYPHVVNVIGNGFALNLEYLEREMQSVYNQVPGLDLKLMIDIRTQVLLPHHILLDTLEEKRRQDREFGSTKSGIAPFYSEKFAKEGLQLNELFDNVHLKQRLKEIYERANLILQGVYKHEGLDYMDAYNSLCRLRKEFAENYAADVPKFLRKSWQEGKTILLEGQLGALKDPDFGIYPYVTSSSTIAGFAPVGTGLPPYAVTNILAVTKAYSSAIGAGAFVSEIFGEEASTLRERGGDAGEYGATTGRARRVGYFDAVATRYGVLSQGATEVAMTGLDVLSYMDEIPVCVAYEIDGIKTADFPVSRLLDKAKPIYEILSGFCEDIRSIRRFDDLPENAKNYVKFIEGQLGVKITTLSNGPKREDMIAF